MGHAWRPKESSQEEDTKDKTKSKALLRLTQQLLVHNCDRGAWIGPNTGHREVQLHATGRARIVFKPKAELW